MKVFILLISLITGILADAYIEKLESASKACGVDGLKELVALEGKNDKTHLGTTLFCINKEIGLQDDKGIINKDKVAVHIKTMLKNKNETFQNDVINDCNEPTGENGAEKAFNFMTCLHQKLKH
ncbi:uncharacterized protein LOC130900032 [Diorhabda carinulata]|uniref:uncharacterized protein LOC130900032 n=1 Tax=Diorhabda carinulata TaxID=1163345 RepID=UPI0025A040BD|nr:uncharacterized protein LOC130900032 [Diorhabda carinulata]